SHGTRLGDSLGRPAGPRVKHVAKLAALVFQVAERRRRRPQRLVPQTHKRDSPTGLPRMTQPDSPAAFVSRFVSYSVHAAMAAVQQGGRQIPALPQQGCGPVQGVTLADRAEIDLQPRTQIADRALFRVEDDVAHADARQGRGTLIVRWHAARTAVEAP